MNSFHGQLRTAQLWRKFMVVVILTVFSSSASAQLKIEKLNLPQGIDAENPYHNVMFNFTENMMRPVVVNRFDSKIEFTVWEVDFSKIYRQFTITQPQGYTDIEYSRLAYVSGRFEGDGGSGYLTLTQDLFNDDDLIEVVINCYNSNNKGVSLIMNERSEVLAQTEEGERIDYVLDPALTGGQVITSNGYIIRKGESALNEKRIDQHEGIVSPNPSSGASSITISWGYTLLNDGKLNVVSTDGKLVHSQRVKSGSSHLNLATAHLAAGSYVYILENDNGYTTTGKFIIN